MFFSFYEASKMIENKKQSSYIISFMYRVAQGSSQN